VGTERSRNEAPVSDLDLTTDRGFLVTSVRRRSKTISKTSGKKFSANRSNKRGDKSISPEVRKRNRDAYAAWLEAQPIDPRKPSRPRWTSSEYVSEVTVTVGAETSRTEPSYTPEQLRRITKERGRISERMRSRIKLRDRGTCRYCGDIHGPFEIDHVIPVSLGGDTAMRNLVLACRQCNQRKGNHVWKPKPVGHF
jgi:5-methylcytosine-specific restriction endonuclease McrA